MNTKRFTFLAIVAVIIPSLGWPQTSVSTVKSPSGELGNVLGGTPQERADQKVVVITGARFTYPLVQKWIDQYNQTNPEAQIIIESRGSSDPSKYDILVEVYEHDEATRKLRDYVHIARYAVLPVANSSSVFAKIYGDKGLNKELINQLFFHDIFADKENEEKIKAPYTIYTRLQKAGVPAVFTSYFGYQQKDIKGKAIAGADEHLLKSILRDSTAVSYLPLTLAYDHTTRKPVEGITILPVDLNGNSRVSDEEKIYTSLDNVIEKVESAKAKELNNVPLGYLHLSVDKATANSEAVAFLRWVVEHGREDLKYFGYLQPEPSKLEKVEGLASKRAQ
jgi:ABC-type phosphate transport system substrate-binding protein